MAQESTNTFSDGLIKDLNPLTTPNTVLTDALNATLLTFNGNELVLQNDMGNTKITGAKLPEGYVPLGIKEFGGILYIVSSNGENIEIGSFPSPEMVNTSLSKIDPKTLNIFNSNDNEINKKYGLKKNDYILFLGRIVPEKQVKLLIEAYKNLETDKKLVIAGGASHTSDYFNEVKECANGRDDIIFTDFVQGEKKKEIYH